MGIGKKKKLRTTFVEYVVSLGLLIIVLILVNYYIFIIASFGVYPANYSEKIIQKNFDKLKKSPTVTMDMLTPMCTFGVYSKDGQYLYGNFPREEENKNWDNYLQGKTNIGLRRYITSIEREEEILIIIYPLNMEYKNSSLRKVLPNAEVTLIILFFLQLSIFIILWSNRFAKKINNELKNLLMAASKIEDQDLDFHIASSNIVEIDNVLQGIGKMKNSLKRSLEQQWALEQQKREQISALAHDIKTPLTIVKGNAGLLMETNMTEEQRSYCKYIEESSRRMEEYVESLLNITKKEVDNGKLREGFSICEMVNSLKNQGQALGIIKDIKFILNIDLEKDLYIRGDKEEVERAVMNIISNAVDFSPNNSSVTLNIFKEDKDLIIQVKDQGKGFSKRMLKYGKEKFSMDDESRTRPGHHGLGLYIANTITTKYNGDLILSNGLDGGGLVTIKLRIM